MLSKKFKGKRAQVSSGELLMAYFIFFLVLTMAITIWSNTTEKIKGSERFYDLEETAVDLAEKLVRTGGVPSTWDKENVTVIGLANEPRVLDQGKVLEFLDMMNDSAYNNPCTGISNYECNKPILGMGKYEFYFTLKDINGTTMEIENISCITGRAPIDEIEKLTVVRTAILEGGIVRVILTVWYGEKEIITPVTTSSTTTSTTTTTTSTTSSTTTTTTIATLLVSNANDSWSTHNGNPYQSFTTQIQLSDDSYANVTDNISYQDALEITFPDLGIPSGVTINSVVFGIEYHASGWTSEGGSGWRDDFEIYDGGWIYVTDWGGASISDIVWISPNVADIINTTEKVNSMRIKLEYDPLASGDICYFDTANVTVNYSIT